MCTLGSVCDCVRACVCVYVCLYMETASEVWQRWRDSGNEDDTCGGGGACVCMDGACVAGCLHNARHQRHAVWVVAGLLGIRRLRTIEGRDGTDMGQTRSTVQTQTRMSRYSVQIIAYYLETDVHIMYTLNDI